MPADSVATLLDPWTGPFGGVPPWDAVDPDAFTDAFHQAIDAAERELEAIATDDEPPTFDNVVAAFERRGRTLDRLGTLFGVHAANLNLGPIPGIQRSVGPLLTAHGDRVVQDERLFARIEAVSGSAGSGSGDGLDGPARRLLDDLHRHFVRNGARLDAEAKAELSAVNQKLAARYVEFAQNVLADEGEQVTWIEDPAQLAGLAPSVVEAIAATAEAKDHPGLWAVANTRSAMDPVLTMADDRQLRERVWRAYYSRGEGRGIDGQGTGAGGDGPAGGDNRPIIADILSLRATRARILGQPSHAHWRLETEMAATPDAAMELMLRVWEPARARAVEEVAAMEELAGHPIEPWDHRYYAEKVRRERYAIDAAELEPYLQLEKLIEAMLWCAGELYGLRFELLAAGTVPVFHPDVRVWDVQNAAGEHVALWYLDPYARPGKLSGAWMNAYRSQERLDEPITTLVSNNSNFVKPADPSQAVLISWDDARTLFHEFGHALHGMLSDVTYPSQSGTSVPRDYVEFPSQLNEHWLSTPEVLQRFCLHHETGEPMPPELIERLQAAENFNQGFDTVEYLAAALYDMRIHLQAGDGAPDGAGDGTGEGAGGIDPEAFEAELMAELGMPTQIVMRHRPTHFAHIFSGDGYSAAYYSYLWADALTADAAEAFTEADGFFDTSVAERLRVNVLSVGDTIDPAEGFRAFRGRDVDPQSLLRKRGLA
ncbi:MAG: M3 family metallopeptidase [Actinomycetota bacterium]